MLLLYKSLLSAPSLSLSLSPFIFSLAHTNAISFTWKISQFRAIRVFLLRHLFRVLLVTWYPHDKYMHFAADKMRAMSHLQHASYIKIQHALAACVSNLSLPNILALQCRQWLNKLISLKHTFLNRDENSQSIFFNNLKQFELKFHTYLFPSSDYCCCISTLSLLFESQPI